MSSSSSRQREYMTGLREASSTIYLVTKLLSINDSGIEYYFDGFYNGIKITKVYANPHTLPKDFVAEHTWELNADYVIQLRNVKVNGTTLTGDLHKAKSITMEDKNSIIRMNAL